MALSKSTKTEIIEDESIALSATSALSDPIDTDNAVSLTLQITATWGSSTDGLLITLYGSEDSNSANAGPMNFSVPITNGTQNVCASVPHGPRYIWVTVTNLSAEYGVTGVCVWEQRQVLT